MIEIFCRGERVFFETKPAIDYICGCGVIVCFQKYIDDENAEIINSKGETQIVKIKQLRVWVK